MPELPDVVVYIEALQQRIPGQTLDAVRVRGPFLLRTVSPPLEIAAGRRVEQLRQLGKRIAIGLEGDLWLALHLMIAGRLHWRKRGVALAAKQTLAGFDFPNGTLLLTEAGSERRAGLHVIQGEAGLNALHSGGLEPLAVDCAEFRERLRSRNHTLKRALTDPHLFSGIGNAYSDEILHAARLSPVALTQRLTDDEAARLFVAVRETLQLWIERLRSEAAGRFPEKVTAFRPDMAVHGRYKLPCPVCGTAVQRIRYASNETNYCPRCQTGGRLLADRSLSRLLREDWPRRIDDIE
jgi:formamidopyrimidine-DNA glycosylase